MPYSSGQTSLLLKAILISRIQGLLGVIDSIAAGGHGDNLYFHEKRYKDSRLVLLLIVNGKENVFEVILMKYR